MRFELSDDERNTILRLVEDEHTQLSQFRDRAYSGKLDRMLIHLENIMEALTVRGQPE